MVGGVTRLREQHFLIGCLVSFSCFHSLINALPLTTHKHLRARKVPCGLWWCHISVVMITLRSVSSASPKLHVLHSQGLAWCLEHSRCSVYLYWLVDEVNKILPLLGQLPPLRARPPGEIIARPGKPFCLPHPVVLGSGF